MTYIYAGTSATRMFVPAPLLVAVTLRQVLEACVEPAFVGTADAPSLGGSV